jgi:hypothetical protein
MASTPRLLKKYNKRKNNQLSYWLATKGGSNPPFFIRIHTMALDEKISFVSGYILTAATAVSMMGLLQAAMVGLFGGFFGLIGKELFYWVKRKMKNG